MTTDPIRHWLTITDEEDAATELDRRIAATRREAAPVVPTATTGHRNVPGEPATRLALMNECKRRPAVEVRAAWDATAWQPATLTAYGQVGDMGAIAFVVENSDGVPLTVAEDRIKFADVDTQSSASVQHFIETGEWLTFTDPRP
jgi:hypothetical protein